MSSFKLSDLTGLDKGKQGNMDLSPFGPGAPLSLAGQPPSGIAPTGMKMASGKVNGLVEPGNIDLTKQPQIKNPDGGVSTVFSMGIEMDGKHVLIPRVVQGVNHILSEQEAIAHYRKTGQHLGIFKSDADADAYASQLHEAYASGGVPGYSGKK